MSVSQKTELGQCPLFCDPVLLDRVQSAVSHCTNGLLADQSLSTTYLAIGGRLVIRPHCNRFIGPALNGIR